MTGSAANSGPLPLRGVQVGERVFGAPNGGSVSLPRARYSSFGFVDAMGTVNPTVLRRIVQALQSYRVVFSVARRYDQGVGELAEAGALGTPRRRRWKR